MTTPVTAQSAQLLYLSDAPHYAPVLARWHFEAWRTLLPRWSEAEALAELQTHRGRCEVDTTRINLLDGRLAGSVSLVTEDHPQFSPLAPWLASLYVHPDARRRGLGETMVRAVVDDARLLGLRELFLFTEDGQTFYERQGWRVRSRENIPGGPVVVMPIDPCAVHLRPLAIRGL